MKAYWMKSNTEKTKNMRINDRDSEYREGNVEQVENYKYLGNNTNNYIIRGLEVRCGY